MKTSRIIFRVDKDIDNFLTKVAYSLGTTKSNLIRRIIIHYFMAYFSENKVLLPYDELKKEFFKANGKT
jgi:hypothetical protein